jgi:hypothetical protein
MKDREMSDNFTYFTVRVEWCSEIYETDQYGQEREIIYSKSFATREEATKDLESISQPHPHVSGRRVANRDICSHTYHDCRVRYREARMPEYTF